MNVINRFVIQHVRTLEMTGVLMRIFSFSVVSWHGEESPFLFVWIVNTIDAIILSWTAIIKKDRAYTLLNIFWIGVGLIGILRVLGIV